MKKGFQGGYVDSYDLWIHELENVMCKERMMMMLRVFVVGGKVWVRRAPACGCLESALRVRRSCRLNQKGILLEPHMP